MMCVPRRFVDWRLVAVLDLSHRSHAQEAAFRRALDPRLPALRCGGLSWRAAELACLDASRAARLSAGAATSVLRGILMMRAKPGSGKTTVSDALAEALSADVVHRDDYKGSGAAASYAEACRKVVLGGKVLIVDEEHVTVERRRGVHKLAGEFGLPIVVVDITANPETCIDRANLRESRRDNGMSRERVTAAIMWAENATMSQPLDGDEEKLGKDYQGYETIVSVDGNASLDDVTAQLSDVVVPEIRACLARATDVRATIDYDAGAPSASLLALPTARERESDGTAHLDSIIAAERRFFASERLPQLFGGARGLAAGSLDSLRSAACRRLGVGLEAAPKPLEPNRVRVLLAEALAAVDAEHARGVLKSSDYRSIVQVAGPHARSTSPAAMRARDAIEAAVESQDRSLAADARQHLEFESFLRCAMPEVEMPFGSYQDVAPGGTINSHNDKAPFDYRLILQYADPGAEFVARVDIARS